MNLKNYVLQLDDIFENFRKMCLKIFELDPVRFISAPGLAWQAGVKKKEVKLELLTDTGMLLMVQKGIRVGICYATHRNEKANNKYMKHYDNEDYDNYLQFN